MKITCDVKTTRKITELKPFQGDIKSMKPKDRQKLISLLETYGIRFPFYVWGDNIINGHQRQDVLINDFGYTGEVPVVEIEAENEKEAKELVLVATSQHGRFNIEELQEFTADLNMEDLDGISLVDGPNINLEISLGNTMKEDQKNVTPLSENIEVVEEGEVAQVEPSECLIKKGQSITFPDGSILSVGDDVYFAEEMVRHWNSRNRTKKVII